MPLNWNPNRTWEPRIRSRLSSRAILSWRSSRMSRLDYIRLRRRAARSHAARQVRSVLLLGAGAGGSLALSLGFGLVRLGADDVLTLLRRGFPLDIVLQGLLLV